MGEPFGNFFGSRLTPPPPKKSLGQVGGLCCSAPDGSGAWCFDANYNASGRCGAVWGYNPADGATVCVPDTSGDTWSVGWVHPSCPSGAPPPPPAPPPEPPPPTEPPPTEPVPTVPTPEPSPEPLPPGLGTHYCCRPDGNLIAITDVTQCPEGTTEVAEGTECPLPSAEEEALACPTNGTFDIYDTETGELIASDVAEADLPVGAEIVAVDDPRCGLEPTIPPPVAPPTEPTPQPVPSDGAVPPIPTGPQPTVPGTQLAPAPGSFTGRFLPCGAQPPVSVRSLRRDSGIS